MTDITATLTREERERQWAERLEQLAAQESTTLGSRVPTIEGLRRAAAKRAHSCLFADSDDTHGVLPVVAARESARRRDTVCFPRLAKGERGAFLVEFGWLRGELAK